MHEMMSHDRYNYGTICRRLCHLWCPRVQLVADRKLGTQYGCLADHIRGYGKT